MESKGQRVSVVKWHLCVSSIHEGGIHSAGESRVEEGNRTGKDKKQNKSNLAHADFEVTLGHPNKYSSRGVAK